MICRLLASFSPYYRTQSGITEWFRRIVTFKAGSEGVGVSREAAVHIKKVEEQIGGKKAVEGGNSWVLYCYDLATDNTDNKQTRSWKGKALYTFYILVRVAGLLSLPNLKGSGMTVIYDGMKGEDRVTWNVLFAKSKWPSTSPANKWVHYIAS